MLQDRPWKDEIQEWQSLRPSKYFTAKIEDEIEHIKNQWAAGEYVVEDNIDESNRLNNDARGRLLGLFYAHSLLTELDEDDFLTEDEEEDER